VTTGWPKSGPRTSTRSNVVVPFTTPSAVETWQSGPDAERLSAILEPTPGPANQWRPTIEHPGDLEESDFAEEMEDRYPDLDPEEAEYVDYMMATGQEPFGGGSGCLLMLIVLITINWLFLGQ